MEGLKAKAQVAPEAPSMPATLPEPYEAPELFDLVFDSFRIDLDFWREAVRESGGPALEVGCGTGRVLLELLASGIDADGVDLFPPMIERARAKMRARGFAPRLEVADMRDFRVPRRYRTVYSAFNTFAHNLTQQDQIATLRCCREHLEPGGVFILHLSLPPPSMWIEPDGEPVLEIEVPHPSSGHPLRMYDTRFKNWVGQSQRSEIELQELDGQGNVARSHRFETSQRWIYPNELELLFRTAGFARWLLQSGFDRGPLGPGTDQMVAFAWKDA